MQVALTKHVLINYFGRVYVALCTQGIGRLGLALLTVGAFVPTRNFHGQSFIAIVV
jgi:hypothetical protein